jgi:inorganic pyrophosphatase
MTGRRLDIGESTLSRLIKNKYMETPIGIIKIQDLFSANVGNHASKSIQHRIIQIIQNENKCIDDIHVTLKDQIEHFFTYYKDLDEGKWVKIDGWGNAEEAKQELLESFASYKK